MKTNVHAVNFDISEKLQAYIAKKTKNYDKKLDTNAELDIRLSVTKPESARNKETSIRILGLSGAGELFAQKTCDTFEEGIDETLEALDRQLEKYKNKR